MSNSKYADILSLLEMNERMRVLEERFLKSQIRELEERVSALEGILEALGGKYE